VEILAVALCSRLVPKSAWLLADEDKIDPVAKRWNR